MSGNLANLPAPSPIKPPTDTVPKMKDDWPTVKDLGGSGDEATNEMGATSTTLDKAGTGQNSGDEGINQDTNRQTEAQPEFVGGRKKGSTLFSANSMVNVKKPVVVIIDDEDDEEEPTKEPAMKRIKLTCNVRDTLSLQ
jgi:hypothetical protein